MLYLSFWKTRKGEQRGGGFREAGRISWLPPRDFSLNEEQGVSGASEGQRLENLATENDPVTMKPKRQKIWHIFRI